MVIKEFDFVDISDYQNTQYKKILKIIFDISSIFKIVDEYEDFPVESLDIYKDLIDVKISNKWQGTTVKGRRAFIYSFKVTNSIRNFLGKYNSFFYIDEDNCVVNRAFKEQQDYSFFEEDGNCILYIITHEGKLYLREDIYKDYFK